MMETIMKKYVAATLMGVVILPAGLIGMAKTAEARPDYCVQKAWDYATRKAGPDRTTQSWNDYNNAFQDYNDCYGPQACNDRDFMCMDPPGI